MKRFVILLAATPFAAFAENTSPATVQQAATVEGQPAPGGNGGQPHQGPPPGNSNFILFMLPLFLLLMWFMIIRPQKKAEKEKKVLLESTKRGDKVITIGGAHGEVIAVGETTLDLKLGQGSDGAVVTFSKAAVASNLTQQAAVDAAKVTK